MKIKINRSISDDDYVVPVGDGMTISIRSMMRSKFKHRLIVLTARKTGYLDEAEFHERNRLQNLEDKAESLALFRQQQEDARREAFLETCITGWTVRDIEGIKVPFDIGTVKEVFLDPENAHQVDDLINISAREELFWKQEEAEAIEQIKKP